MTLLLFVAVGCGSTDVEAPRQTLHDQRALQEQARAEAAPTRLESCRAEGSLSERAPCVCAAICDMQPTERASSGESEHVVEAEGEAFEIPRLRYAVDDRGDVQWCSYMLPGGIGSWDACPAYVDRHWTRRPNRYLADNTRADVELRDPDATEETPHMTSALARRDDDGSIRIYVASEEDVAVSD